MNSPAAAPALKLAELAERIDAHLRRLEADKDVNVNPRAPKLKMLYSAAAEPAGRFVAIRYVSYQGFMNVSKADALAYLAALDGGFVGRHFEALAIA